MKKLKIGIFGCGSRGLSLGKEFLLMKDCEVVALCEKRAEREEPAREVFGKDCKWFSNFDEFIKEDLDAVVLTNYFNEHAPYAIRCMEKNIHILSECISNGTMAEGVQLVKAAKKSKSIYMLSENYPQMTINREMQRVVATGTLGQILYAEGEYNHPGNPADTAFRKEYNYYPEHWRNFLPRTYYITHSLGPLMRATGATPKTVSAHCVAGSVSKTATTASHVSDRVGIITMTNDDGSIFRVTGCANFGAHHNAYRICGTKGQIENLRGMGEKIMLRYNDWNIPEGLEEINLYDAPVNDPDEALIRASGHGGGDYVTVRMFVQYIRDGKQLDHPYNVDAAVAMSSCAILAHRSMLEGGKPYDIPDFNDEKWCKMYENDYLTPFYGPNGEKPTMPCCSVTDYAPTEEQVQRYLDSLK